MLTGFQHKKLQVAGSELDVQLAGEGPPLLLLHGFPETKLAWHKIAPELSETHTVILPDLPGYGDSTAPPPGADYKNFSKRSHGNILVAAMDQLGFNEFALAGHDRGARVAYRMALDHPQKITRLAVLNIIPTLDMVELLDYETAVDMGNWFFLAQPSPLPEMMLEKNAEVYLQHVFETWSRDPSQISPQAKEAYLRSFKRREVVKAICDEYRATAWDIEYDREDRHQNRRIQCPVLALWSKEGIPVKIVDPFEVWNRWANKVSGAALEGGHFFDGGKSWRGNG